MLIEFEACELMPEVEFSEQELIIEKGRKTFIEVGKALAEIRERKGYRFQYGTFEEYCSKRWGWSVRTGYNLIAASEVAENVRKIENVQPVAQIDYTKSVLLSTLAPEDQIKFVKEHDVFKMTKRELESQIKASKLAERQVQEAEERAKEAERRATEAQTEVKRLNSEISKQPEPQVIEKEVISPKVQQQLAEAERLIHEKDKLQSENKLLRLNLEEAQEKANREPQVVEVIPPDYDKLKAKVEEQQTELHHLTRAQLTLKDKQKVKTDATLLVQELVKNTERLKFDYAQVGELDRDTDQHIESAAKVCDRMAQELRSLVYTMEVESIGQN